jgi:hypothetical protein
MCRICMGYTDLSNFGVALRSRFAEFGETYTRVGLSLNLGLAARAPKRDGYHGCPYPILATRRASWTAGESDGSE